MELGQKLLKTLIQLVYNAEDSVSFADSIFRFSKLSKEERDKLGINARKYFEKEFQRSRLLKRLIDIFEK